MVELDLVLEHASDNILDESLKLGLFHGGRKAILVREDVLKEIRGVLQTDQHNVLDPDQVVQFELEVVGLLCEVLDQWAHLVWTPPETHWGVLAHKLDKREHLAEVTTRFCREELLPDRLEGLGWNCSINLEQCIVASESRHLISNPRWRQPCQVVDVIQI